MSARTESVTGPFSEVNAARWKTQAGLAWRALFPDSDMSEAPKYWQRRWQWNRRRGTLCR